MLPSSCHPKQTTRAIPKRLGLIIVRICSDPKKRDLRLKELKESLVERGYQEEMVKSTVEKVQKIPRKAALKKGTKPNQAKRPGFAYTFDPWLPPVTGIIGKHWRSMASRDKYLREVFPSPPLTEYRRQPNIRSHLIRATLPDSRKYPKRNQRGLTKCNLSNCTECPYIKETKQVNLNGTSWNINKPQNFNTYNVIYGIECKKDICKEV